jgi:hypothetical protein
MNTYKSGNEFLLYHPSASHIPPDFRDGWNACFAEAGIHIAQLQAEVEAHRKDAERYQWLRSQHWEKSELCVVEHPRASIRLGFDCPSLLRLDEIIDVAIARDTQEQA